MPSKDEKKKGPTEEEIKCKHRKLMRGYLKEIEGHENTIVETERKVLQDAKKVGFDGEIYKKLPLNIREAAGDGNVVEVSNFLRKGFGADEPDEEGNTALIYACQNNHFKTAVILIENKANVNHASKFGFTPLMFASWKGHVDVVSLLLKHNADVKAVTAHKDTALHLAALCGFSMVCLLLRKAGAEMGVKNDRKKTPMDNAKTYSVEFEVSLKENLPKQEVIFTQSKSIFGMKQVARELSKMVEGK